MKIGIYGGEAFPVYQIWSDGFSEIDVDEETLARWRSVFEEFSAVQQEITEKMEEQGQGHNVWSHGIWDGFRL